MDYSRHILALDDVGLEIRWAKVMAAPKYRRPDFDPGSRPGNGDTPEPVGVPYGSRARLIMLYLQSEALRTKSREVTLGRSMSEWLRRMGVPIGGKSMLMIRDQAERISRCRLSFNVSGSRGLHIRQQTIVDDAIFLDTSSGAQG